MERRWWRKQLASLSAFAAIAMAVLSCLGCGARTPLADLSGEDDASVDAPESPASFTIEIPFGRDPNPGHAVMSITPSIQQADVAVAMDTTGSMTGSINNLKSNLSSRIFPALRKAISSVGIAVVDYKDYPEPPFGSPGDYPVRILQTTTTEIEKAQLAVGSYFADGGNDAPEAQIPAMMHALTGRELAWATGRVEARKAAPGRWGGADFRPGSLPVVVLITDVDWHDADDSPYDDTIHAPPVMSELVAAFNAVGAKFIDVTNGAMGSPEGQADQLSDATHSNLPLAAFGAKCGRLCCTGVGGAGRPATGPMGSCRLNFLHRNGDGVSDSIVSAIQAISVGYRLDVVAIASNDPANPVGIDATKFIRALRAIDEGDAGGGCARHAAKDTDGDGVKDTFLDVVVGTRVCFEVLARRNDSVSPIKTEQSFDAFIDVIGVPGSVHLDRRTVRFVVPSAP